MSLYVKVRHKAYQTLFIITVLSLAGVSSLPLLFRSFFKGSQAIAVVNNMPITASEYQRVVMFKEQELQALKQQFGDAASELLRSFGLGGNPHELALEQLIQEKVRLSLAQQAGIVLSADYITRRLQDPRMITSIFGETVPNYLVTAQGKIDINKLRLFLQRQGLTVQEFEQSIEHSLQENMVILLAQQAAMVSPAQIEIELLRNYGIKKFTLRELDLAPYYKKAQEQKPSEQELQSYYERHHYWSAEKRTGTVWIFKQKSYDIVNPQARTDDFEERFMKDVQGILHAPAQAIQAFAQQKNSVSKRIVDQELRNQEQNKVLQQLFALAPGSRQAFVHNNVGYIVELTQVKPRSQEPLQMVKEKVARDMLQERAQKMAFEDLSNKHAQVKKVTFTWQPEKASPELAQLHKEGIQLEQKISCMFMQGQQIQGATKNSVYQLTLEQITPSGKDDKKKAHIVSRLERESRERIAHELIASSREHATITMNTSLPSTESVY